MGWGFLRDLVQQWCEDPPRFPEQVTERKVHLRATEVVQGEGSRASGRFPCLYQLP